MNTIITIIAGAVAAHWFSEGVADATARRTNAAPPQPKTPQKRYPHLPPGALGALEIKVNRVSPKREEKNRVTLLDLCTVFWLGLICLGAFMLGLQIVHTIWKALF